MEPLKTLAVGPHPDSIEARGLTEKRQYGCTEPGFPHQCGSYCCMAMDGCNLAGNNCGCGIGFTECSNGKCCMTGWTCPVTGDECTLFGGSSSDGKSAGNMLVSSNSMGLLAAVAAVVIAA
ncbi:hypothetical protein BGZ83_006380 [Gryganskiella cystojenkinii]|nr:hypothetical protein BGZ83_006380 [Gryganskiella cystojenkinii]